MTSIINDLLKHFKKASFVLALCSLHLIGHLQAEELYGAQNIIRLWPAQAGINLDEPKETVHVGAKQKKIRITDITNPSMLYFPAKNASDKAPAFLLCPGGAYKVLVVSKMTAIAQWLNEQGIHAFVLKYRAPKQKVNAFQDAQRAMRIIKSKASEYGIDLQRIGVMGSSAGGHLSARLSTAFDKPAYEPMDDIDNYDCKPFFTVLLYPAYMNKGASLSPDFKVNQDLAPTLIISARDDKKFFQGSEVYEKALEKVGASIRVHYFDKGGHGFDLHPKEHPLSTWPELCKAWFEDIGFL
jgi:acetyl esterase/lipase